MKKKMVQIWILVVVCFVGYGYLWMEQDSMMNKEKAKAVCLRETREKENETRYWRLPGNGSYVAVIQKGEADLPGSDPISYQELTGLLEEQKCRYPDRYPLFVTGMDITADKDISGYFIAYECPWGTLAKGVLMKEKPQKAVNLFETEEFYEFICQMRDWYEAGYIYPEAATTRVSLEDALANGEISGYLIREPFGPSEAWPDIASQKESEIAEIENTMQEFLKEIETGCCVLLEEEYEIFLRDLKKAGIDQTIWQSQGLP